MVAQRGDRLGHQGRARFFVSLPPDRIQGQGEIEAGASGGGFQHADRRLGDLGPDPVAREHREADFAVCHHFALFRRPSMICRPAFSENAEGK
jgi:hypothetical protein